MQWMDVRVPVIEATDDADLARVRRPHAEADTSLVSGTGEVRAQFVVSPVMPPFIEKIDILLAEQADVRACAVRGSLCCILHESQCNV